MRDQYLNCGHTKVLWLWFNCVSRRYGYRYPLAYSRFPHDNPQSPPKATASGINLGKSFVIPEDSWGRGGARVS